jgi:hypothetical protein
MKYLLLLVLCTFGCNKSYEKVEREPMYGNCSEDRVLMRYNEPDDELHEIYLKKAKTQARAEGCWVDLDATKQYDIVMACCPRS